MQRQMPTSSRHLSFLGDDDGVAVVRPDGVDAFELDGARRWRYTTDAPIGEICLVGDELWIVSAELPLRITRLAAQDGAPRGSHVLSQLGPGRLTSSVFAPGTAGWLGAPCALLTAAGAELVATPLDAETSLVVPTQPGTFLIERAGVIQLRRDAAVIWTQPAPDSGALIDGAPLFDCRMAGLIAAPIDDRGHRVIVLDLRNGGIQHSLVVKRLLRWSFAPLRGQVVADVGDRLLVLDLRFAAVVHEWPLEAPCVGLATNGNLRQVAVRHGDDEALTILSGGSTIASTNLAPADRSAAGVVARVPAAERPQGRELEAADDDDDDRPLPTTLAALWPRPTPARTSAEESRVVLDHQITFVAALAARAIAAAWDSGRLARQEEDRLPFETEVLGILQVARNRARTQLADAEQRASQTFEGLMDAVRTVGNRKTPVALLAEEFGLSPLGAQILVVVAAPVLRGELARLYGILANDTGRALVDELLVAQILASRATRAELTRELDRDSPLRRFGLIVAAETGSRPFAALAVDPLVIRRLRDLPLDADVEAMLRLVPASRRVDELRVARGKLAAFLGALEAASDRPARLVVRGRAGSGRRTVLAAAAALAGRGLGVIDVSRASREGGVRAAAITDGLRRAMLRGWLPCVEGIDDIAEDDKAGRHELIGVFAAHPGPLALRLPWDVPAPLEPGYVQLDLPVATERERRAAWGESLTRHALAVARVDEIASKFRVGPGVIERVSAEVAARAAPGEDASVAVDHAVRQHLQVRFGQLAQRVRRLSHWTDVILPADVKDSVLEFVARIRHRKRVYEEWGFDRAMTTSRGISALFQGGPGTGKTMVAGVIANELQLELYRIDLSRVVSKWIGETERNLAEIFDAAEDGQAIILFDEADSLFAKRTEVKTSVDRYANLEVNYLLQRLDSFEGIAILTTNFGGSIDRAFQRRLSLRLTFPFPDEEMREQLWRVHLPSEIPREGEFDLAALAQRYSMSGGYIRNATLRAAFLAAEEGTGLSQQHLERAVRLEFREIGKLSESGTLE